MEIKGWLSYSKERLNRHGISALPLVAQGVVSTATRLAGLDRRGERIFDREWDVLVVLDACRYDMYERVIGGATPFTSCASTSKEWMAKNFSPEYSSVLAETAYITGNPYSRTLSDVEFGRLDETWRDCWDSDAGTILPGPLTDRAIRTARDGDFDRIIVHYMQPHYPFLGDDEVMGAMSLSSHGTSTTGNVWDDVALGNADPEDVIRAYEDNLRYVYERVQTLLENVNGKVVLTADHGNALGEYGLWGHPAHIPIDGLRTVPWDVYHCTDRETYTPTADQAHASVEETAVADHLSDLGYLE